MSRVARAAACSLLASALSVGALAASGPAAATHCPLGPAPAASEAQVAGCYYPQVGVSANPTSVVVGSGTSTISYTVIGADPSRGCYKSGGWSGTIADKNNFSGNPWSFEGHQGTNCNVENCSDKAFGTAQTITTQGKFQACALVVVFCSTKHPYIEVVINRGGGFTLVKATP